jgi:ubiquinone/menaquinone biosynthesis C-methylase UbiE
MGIRSRLFATMYDRQMAAAERLGLRELRRRLLGDADGDVLEIGAGTGANLALYGAAVRSLTVTEPEAPMLKRLERRAHEDAPAATVLRAPAEDLPFDDGVFDVVVSTLVLCGVSDQPRALRQIRRVLRPGGRLLFLEHVRSDDPRNARRQDRMNPINRLVVCCECNRPTPANIAEAGFTITSLELLEFPKAPSFLQPLAVGSAAAPVPAGAQRFGASERA